MKVSIAAEPAPGTAESRSAPQRPDWLPRADLAGDVPTQLRELAARLDFDRYLTIGGILTQDHAFWEVLLPDGDGEMLVLENRLGALTASCAARGRRVACLPVSAYDAEAAQQRFRAAAKVRVISAARLAEMDAPSAVVLAGLSAPHAGADPAGLEGALATITARLPAWLDRGTAVLVMDNNRATYRRAEGVPGRDSLLAVRRRLRQAGAAHFEAFAADSVLTPDLWPPPEFVSRAERALPPLGASRLRSRLVRQSWTFPWRPAYLCIASREPRTSLLQEMVEESGLTRSAEWRGEPWVLKKLIAGNAGITVAIVGPCTRRGADAVLRIPFTAEGEARCARNAKALRALRSTGLSPYVPELLYEGRRGGRLYTVERRCAGHEAVAIGKQGPAIIRAVWEDWARHAECMMQTRALSVEAYDAEVASALRDIAGFCGEDERARLAALDDWLRAELTGRPIVQGYAHGDFKPGNMLFDERGRLAAIFDWDRARPDGILMFDFLSLLTNRVSQRLHGSLSRACIEHLIPGRFGAEDDWLYARASARLAPDPRTRQALRVAAWFVLLRDQVAAAEKLHPEWHAAHVTDVLRALQAGGVPCG